MTRAGIGGQPAPQLSGEREDAERARVLRDVRAAVTRGEHADPHRYPIHVEYEDGVLTVAGEVPDVAAKKRTLKAVAAVPGVRWVADRLRVEPAVRMGDGEILKHVRDALLEERAFEACALRSRGGEAIETVQEPADARGEIVAAAGDGVVILEGRVPSLAHKRIAGVLSWWVPGSRDVVNDLEVLPPEDDSDDELTDDVRVVLEMDPFLDATQILVSAAEAVVTLRGFVISEEQKAMAEHDAWYTWGVDGVINDIQTMPEMRPSVEGPAD